MRSNSLTQRFYGGAQRTQRGGCVDLVGNLGKCRLSGLGCVVGAYPAMNCGVNKVKSLRD